MAIAHVCIQCGLDLARCRPHRDPHYGLPLVICPACGRASVRLRHPMQRRWRQVNQIGFALSLMLFQLMCAVPIGALTLGMLFMAAEFNFELPQDRDGRFAAFSGFAGIALLNGTWLAAAFSHLPRYKVWIGWAMLLAACLALVMFITAATGYGPGINTNASSFGQLTFSNRFSLVLVRLVAPMLALLLAIMAAAPIGILPGKLILRFIDAVNRFLWRRRRRRLRTLRTGA